MASRSKNASRNIAFAIANRLVNIFLPFITRTLVLYLLGSVYLGIGTLFSSILSFLSLTELGLSSAITYAMYKPLADGDDAKVCALLSYYRKMYYAIGTIMLIVGTVLLPFIPVLIKGNPPTGLNIYVLYYIYLINTVISFFIGGYRQCLISANQRNDIVNKIGMVVLVFNNLFQVAALYFTRNYYVYAFVPIVGTLITNFSNIIITKKMYPNINCSGILEPEAKTSIRKRISGLFGTKLNSVVIHQADTLVISSFLGLTVLAEYGNYYYIMNAICGFIMVLFSSITAGVGNKIALDSLEENKKLFEQINFVNAWLVGIASTCFMCLYQPFMELWVGKDLMLSTQFVVLFVSYFYIYEIQRTILTFKDAAGLWYEDRYRPYVSMIFNVVSNLILVQFIGIYGIVLSSVLAFFISLPWVNYVLFRYLFKESAFANLIKMLKFAALSVTQIAVAYMICEFININSLILTITLRLMVSLCVANVIYYVALHNDANFEGAKKMLFKVVREKKKRV